MKSSANIFQVILNTIKWILRGIKGAYTYSTENWNDQSKPWKAIRALSFWGIVGFIISYLPVTVVGLLLFAFVKPSIAEVMFQILMGSEITLIWISSLTYWIAFRELE